MALLKKKITFTDLCNLALIAWGENFYQDREELTRLANKQVDFKLTQEQTEKLWARFEQFYLMELYLFGFANLKGKHQPVEISKTIYVVYCSYLVHQRGMSREAALDLIAKVKSDYAEDFLKDTMNKTSIDGISNLKGENLIEVLNIASREFCTSFHFYDVPNETTDQFKDGMFDSELIAYKLIRPTVPFLQLLFSDYRVVWDKLPDPALDS